MSWKDCSFPSYPFSEKSIVKFLMEIFESLDVSIILKILVIFSLFTISCWLTAAWMNSLKSSVPSPSKSHFSNTSIHKSFSPSNMPLISVPNSKVHLRSYFERLPSISASSFVKTCLSFLYSGLSIVKLQSREMMVFCKLDNAENFWMFFFTRALVLMEIFLSLFLFILNHR